MGRCLSDPSLRCSDYSPKLGQQYGFVTAILANEAEIIESIQYHYKILSSQIAFLSVISDPAIAFYLVFPIGYYLAPGIGLVLLWVAAISDVLSSMLKILLQENRPYWWVSKHNNNMPTITLVQYPLTCSALPGGPSSHCLVTAAVWWAMLITIGKWRTPCEKKALTFLFSVFMMLVALSRSFLASNFPHQSLMGIIIGMAAGSHLSTLRCYNSAPIRYFTAGAVIITLSQVYKHILPLLGFTIKWTYCTASNYCNDLEWVTENMDHSMIPFIRSASTLFGAGFSLLMTSTFHSSQIKIKPDATKRSASFLLALILITILKCCLLSGNHLHMKAEAFYLCLFSQFFLTPVVVILLVPPLMKLYLWEASSESQS